MKSLEKWWILLPNHHPRVFPWFPILFPWNHHQNHQFSDAFPMVSHGCHAEPRHNLPLLGGLWLRHPPLAASLLRGLAGEVWNMMDFMSISSRKMDGRWKFKPRKHGKTPDFLWFGRYLMMKAWTYCGKKQCIFGRGQFLSVFFLLGDVDYLCRFSGFRTKELVKSKAFWGFLRILVNFDKRFREVYGF